MSLKGAKKRSYNKKYYFKNKDKDIISTRKKEAYYEDLDKSREEFATRSKTNYDKHPDSGAKSTARSKVNYDRDPESGAKSTARSKANRDPDSGTKSTARSKANYGTNQQKVKHSTCGTRVY